MVLGLDGAPEFNARHSRKNDHEVQFFGLDALALRDIAGRTKEWITSMARLIKLLIFRTLIWSLRKGPIRAMLSRGKQNQRGDQC